MKMHSPLIRRIVFMSILAAACIAQAASWQNIGQFVPLNTLWRVIPYGSNRMTTPNMIEERAYNCEGAIFYVPMNSVTNSKALYRLYNPVNGDHIDSPWPGEGGYQTSGIIGYPWISQTAQPGTTQLIRVYNPTIVDFATRGTNESLAGYSVVQPLNLYGFRRYNNAITSMLRISAGGVDIDSNAASGGAIWSWKWHDSSDNTSTEFINTSGYGRLLQSALFLGDATKPNPTEAGDKYSDPYLYPEIRPSEWHGSPLLELSNSGTTQVSTAIPLEFNPELILPGRADSPIIWKDVRMGKRITLNFQNMGPVTKYVTYLYIPNVLENAFMEIPTAHMLARFNRFWTYDAVSDNLTEVFPVYCSGFDPIKFSPSFGGVIISDATTSKAMGVYGAKVSSGGSVSFFYLFDIRCGLPNSNLNATTKWSAIYNWNSLSAGAHYFTTYVMSDSVNKIRGYMRSLYLAGVK